MRKAYFVPRGSGGHRARPQWTIHNVQTIHTTYSPCGVVPRNYYPASDSWPRPQGEVRVCRRCFPAQQQQELREKWSAL